MVVVFLVPVLDGRRAWRAAPASSSIVTAVLTVDAVRGHSGRVGTAITLLLVNMFPARRARDILMLMGLLFAAAW